MDNFNQGPRPKFQGNWTCAKCGKTITELPFKPREDGSPVKCFECHKADRQQFGGRR